MTNSKGIVPQIGSHSRSHEVARFASRLYVPNHHHQLQCVRFMLCYSELGGYQLSKEAELAHSVYCNSKPRVLGHTIEARAEKALLDRRHVPPKDLMKEIQRETGSDLPYPTQPTKLLSEPERGCSRKNLPAIEKYVHISSNLGTVYDIAQDDDGTIQRVFIFCMSACQNVLAYSKPVVMLDACHMTSSQKGRLFVAYTQDGDNHIVPLAFCFGVSEDESTWTYFLSHLRSTIPIAASLPVVFISDAQKGLRNSIANVFPECFATF